MKPWALTSSSSILIPSSTLSYLEHNVQFAPHGFSARMTSISGVGPSSRARAKSRRDNYYQVLQSESHETTYDSSDGFSRGVFIGTVSLGLVMLLIGFDGEKALAFGPEGPMVEEFWENVRRYALYALTVSTGAVYTILQPIFELLKNPISAILVLIIIGGSIYIVSQVLSAMVGFTDFTYDYGY